MTEIAIQEHPASSKTLKTWRHKLAAKLRDVLECLALAVATGDEDCVLDLMYDVLGPWRAPNGSIAQAYVVRREAA